MGGADGRRGRGQEARPRGRRPHRRARHHVGDRARRHRRAGRRCPPAGRLRAPGGQRRAGGRGGARRAAAQARPRRQPRLARPGPAGAGALRARRWRPGRRRPRRPHDPLPRGGRCLRCDQHPRARRGGGRVRRGVPQAQPPLGLARPGVPRPRPRALRPRAAAGPRRPRARPPAGARPAARACGGSAPASRDYLFALGRKLTLGCPGVAPLAADPADTKANQAPFASFTVDPPGPGLQGRPDADLRGQWLARSRRQDHPLRVVRRRPAARGRERLQDDPLVRGAGHLHDHAHRHRRRRGQDLHEQDVLRRRAGQRRRCATPTTRWSGSTARPRGRARARGSPRSSSRPTPSTRSRARRTRARTPRSTRPRCSSRATRPA